MKARDYLWCALNLMLDREEMLCPACQSREASYCAGCGTPLEEWSAGENAAFDEARFERLRRGEHE